LYESSSVSEPDGFDNRPSSRRSALPGRVTVLGLVWCQAIITGYCFSSPRLSLCWCTRGRREVSEWRLSRRSFARNDSVELGSYLLAVYRVISHLFLPAAAGVCRSARTTSTLGIGGRLYRPRIRRPSRVSTPISRGLRNS
jgi:hypothetical protein